VCTLNPFSPIHVGQNNHLSSAFCGLLLGKLEKTAPAVSGPETSAPLDGHNGTSKSRPPFRCCCAIHRVGLLLMVREGSAHGTGDVTRNLARE
jgi:hypothetical protein